MSSNRIASLGVLGMGVALGYFAAGGFYRPSEETATSVTLLAPPMDATCSTASPSTAICEMPGEISRADYFRLASTANAAGVERKLRAELPLPAAPAPPAPQQ